MDVNVDKLFHTTIVNNGKPFNPNKDIELFRVGGCVRDQFLKIKSKDVDYIVTNIRYEELLRVLTTEFNGKIVSTPVGDTMNVIKLKLDDENEPYDFAIPRKDYYDMSGSHQGVSSIGDPSMSIEDDLGRRDFTMNAIAQNCITNEIIDPFNGIGDIKGSRIRAVGDASIRFKEDALRILRAIQFSIRLNFIIDEFTFGSMLSNAGLLTKITGERIDGEFSKIFKHRGLFGYSQLTYMIKPFSEVLFGSQLNCYYPHDVNAYSEEDTNLLAYAMMFSNSGNNTHKRLKLSSKHNKLIELVQETSLIQWHHFHYSNFFKHIFNKPLDIIDLLKEYMVIRYGEDYLEINNGKHRPSTLPFTSEYIMEKYKLSGVSLGKVLRELCYKNYRNEEVTEQDIIDNIAKL